MKSSREGTWAAMAAFVMWGFMTPVTIHWIGAVDPITIFHFRILASAPLLAVLLLLVGKLRAVQWSELVSPGNIVAALMIGGNWFTFVICVQTYRSYQASFGYFVAPLLVALCGALFLGETLLRRQWIAVLLAVVAIFLFGFAIGGLPLLAVSIALTFTLYSLIGKIRPGSPITLVASELIVLMLLGLLALPFEVSRLPSVTSPHFVPLLTLSLFTALPLWLYREASSRIPLSRLGFMNYTAPTLQLLTGILLFNEPWDHLRLLAFGFIWVGLFLFLSPKRDTTRS